MTEMPGRITTPTDAVLTFPLQIGALIRTRARRTIEGQAMLAGLKLECVESRGWFESTFYFRVSGPSDSLIRFSRWLDQWQEQMRG